MVADDELMRDKAQLADYRKSNALKDILDKYEALIEDHRRLKSDYEEERESREKYKQMARGQGRNPFVLVLVDGDGYIFNEDLVGTKGVEGEGSAERLSRGGTNAARRLNDAIKDSLRGKGFEQCQVMVRVYANVAGLSKALSRAGLVGAEKRSFAPFIASFNRSSGLSDFVDAGELKENADFKLRSLLQLYAENAQCKHIYFAACHDVGYVSDLAPHAGNSERFTLINSRGIKFHDEFRKLGMGVEELQGVFRSTPLDGPPAFYRAPNASFPNNMATKAAASPIKQQPRVDIPTVAPTTGEKSRPICDFYKIGKCRYGATCKNLHISSSTNSPSWRSPSEDRPVTNGSAKADRSVIPTDSLPKKENIPEGHIAVNKNNYRLDPYITPPSHEATLALRARINRQRICNAYHLNGFCLQGSSCGFDHSPLEPPLKSALESLARSQPCPKRGSCRKLNCTHGHICQTPDCRHRGGKANCKVSFTAHNEDLNLDKYVPAETRPHQSRQQSYTTGTGGGGSVKEDDMESSSRGGEDDDDLVSVDGSNGASVEYAGLAY